MGDIIKFIYTIELDQHNEEIKCSYDGKFLQNGAFYLKPPSIAAKAYKERFCSKCCALKFAEANNIKVM